MGCSNQHGGWGVQMWAVGQLLRLCEALRAGRLPLPQGDDLAALAMPTLVGRGRGLSGCPSSSCLGRGDDQRRPPWVVGSLTLGLLF